jgi:hypothetical protein
MRVSHGCHSYIQYQYEHPYDQTAPYMAEAGPPTAGPSSIPADNTLNEKPRGRKRTRNTVGFISSISCITSV